MLIHTQSEMDSVRKYGPFILVQSCWLQPEVMKLKGDYNEYFQEIYFKLFFFLLKHAFKNPERQ